MRRLAAAACLALVAVLGVAPSAWAHAELTGSNPAEGTTLAVAPERIELTFNEPIDADLTVITVTGADDVLWRVGRTESTGMTVSIPVTPAGPAGPCTVWYHISSTADGDPIEGEVTFTLAKAPPRATNPPATTDDPYAAQPDPDPITAESANAGGGGLPLWVWLLMGAVVAGIAVGSLIVWRPGPRGRRKS